MEAARWGLVNRFCSALVVENPSVLAYKFILISYNWLVLAVSLCYCQSLFWGSLSLVWFNFYIIKCCL